MGPKLKWLRMFLGFLESYKSKLRYKQSCRPTHNLTFLITTADTEKRFDPNLAAFGVAIPSDK